MRGTYFLRPRAREPRAILSSGARGFSPVELYRVGDVDFVVDGHHRVSVARAQGAPTMDHLHHLRRRYGPAFPLSRAVRHFELSLVPRKGALAKLRLWWSSLRELTGTGPGRAP